VTPEERHQDAIDAAREWRDEERARDLSERNREILAERLHWPKGALKACRRIEATYPGIEAGWFSEWTVPGFERKEGYYAWRAGTAAGRTAYIDGKQVWLRRKEWYGKTPKQLALHFAEARVAR
jgi:hypothetical protein